MKIQTLQSITQKGAQLFFNLSGAPENVSRDAFLMFNHGIADLPEHYDETKDSTVALPSNLYRIAKVVRADKKAKTISRGGWKSLRASLKSGRLEESVKSGVRGFVRQYRTACEPSLADYGHTFALSSYGARDESSDE